MGFSIGDIPVLGDIHKGIFGDPASVKAAYDKQIAASQQQSEAMKSFLMGQKGQAQAFYNPIQHMFQSAYGTEGVQAPQIPQAQQAPSGPISNMYAKGQR